MLNNKILYRFTIAIFIIVTSTSIYFLSNINKKTENITKTENFKTPYNYMVKEIAGKINIFKDGNEKPIKIIKKNISNLPEYDRIMLQNGIYVDDVFKLYKTLEDYDY